MKVVPFIADSAEDAVAQIRAQLGPRAVVLNVRQLPHGALSRLWQKPRIEVIACLPDTPGLDAVTPPIAPPPAPAPALEQTAFAAIAPPLDASMLDEPRVNYQASVYARAAESSAPPVSPAAPAEPAPLIRRDYGGWRVGELLEAGGLLPRYAQRVVDRLKAAHGERPPESLAEELHLARRLLLQSWTRDGKLPAERGRVLVGAPGVGKSTTLCKWLVRSVMVEGCSARVWRLDSQSANTAESVSVFCDILGVPIERAPNPSPVAEERLFVDLPGVNAHDPAAIQALKVQLAALEDAQAHLVLNAAYEMPVLLAQVRAFSVLPIQGLIFTHLDEETRWGKIWNFVFGTNYTVRFLSAGQNVPGDFFEATAEQLVSRLFS